MKGNPMPDPAERISIGSTDCAITQLGLGVAQLSGARKRVGTAEATAVVAHALGAGIRYFDTAPAYGHGEGERRLGAALTQTSIDDIVISTKAGWSGGGPDEMFDFSAAGVTRSLHESLSRLQLDHVDILLLHQPKNDQHWQQAAEEAMPALTKLRAEGVIRAIGVGVTQAGPAARLAREAAIDVVMCAGRYGLMEQSALDDLLPTCLRRGISVLIAGVLHNGLIADPSPGARYNYRTATDAQLRQAQEIGRICADHDVTPIAASVQFALAHPAVTALVSGAATTSEVDGYRTAMLQPLPAELWDELRDAGHIPRDAPTPEAQ